MLTLLVSFFQAVASNTGKGDAGDLVSTEDEQSAEQLVCSEDELVCTEDEQSAGDSSGTADSKLPTRENTVSMKLLLHILNTDHYIWKV